MLNNAIVKTGWARRQQQIVVILLGLVILAVALWASPGHHTYVLDAGGHHYALEPVATEQLQDKGLSGRTSLAANKGMIFIFRSEASQCFWMKGMKFPLDIIWVNTKHSVVYLKRDVSPSTYPQTFCSKNPASFVIELNAGESVKSGIHKGQVLKF